MILGLLRLSESQARYYCTPYNQCCSVAQIGNLGTSVLSSQVTSVSLPFAFFYSQQSPTALLSYSYIQFSPSSSASTLKLSFSRYVTRSSIMVNSMNLSQVVNFLLQFNYMATDQYELRTFTASYVRVGNLKQTSTHVIILPNGSSLVGFRFLCFLQEFDIGLTNSTSTLGFTISFAANTSPCSMILRFTNSFNNSLYSGSINYVFYDKAKLQLLYKYNSLELLYTAQPGNSPFASGDPVTYSGFFNQYNTLIPGTVNAGINGFGHQQNKTTYSLGLTISQTNQIIASSTKNNYPLHSSNLGTVYFTCLAFALYQYSCPAPSVLNPNRSACVSSCPSGFFNNSCRRCMPCHQSCLTCTGSQYFQSCLSCYSDQHRSIKSIGGEGACLCKTGFAGPMKLNLTCLPCHSSCLQCFLPANKNQCLSCADPSRELTQFGCYCRSSFYNQNQTCQPCSVSCLTCYSSVSLCTGCQEGSHFVRGNFTCILCGPNQKFDSYFERCLCSKGYFIVAGVCSFYGMTVPVQQQKFKWLLELSRQISKVHSGLVKVSFLLGFNSLLLNFFLDSQLLRLHLMANQSLSQPFWVVLKILDTDLKLPTLQQVQLQYLALVSPQGSFRPESRAALQQQFPNGRFIVPNLFGFITNLAVIFINTVVVLAICSLFKILIKNHYLRLKITKVRRLLLKYLARWKLRLFIFYMETVLQVQTKAAAMVTIGPASASPYLHANLFLSVLILSFHVVATVFTQIKYLQSSSTQRLNCLFIFDRKLSLNLLHRLCHLAYSMRVVLVPCIVIFGTGFRTPYLLLVFYNIIISLLFFLVRQSIQGYVLKMVRQLLYVLLQCFLLLLQKQSEGKIFFALTYVAIAMMAGIVTISLLELTLESIQALKGFFSSKLKRSRSKFRALAKIKHSRCIINY